MKRMQKEVVWMFYIFLILVMGIVGYYTGGKKRELFSSVGIILGVVMSTILWLTWGKTNTY